MEQTTLPAIMDHIKTYFEKHDIYYTIHEPGIDNEKQVIVADWNKVDDDFQSYIENFYETDWEDESTTCWNCYQHIHTSPSYYGDSMRYINTDEGALCKTCALENPEWIFDEFTFDSAYPPVYPRAIPEWLKCKLEEHGYVPFQSVDSACKDIFESGFHAGQTDTPEKVCKLVTELLGPRDMLFCIDSSGQFDVHFSAYIKKEN